MVTSIMALRGTARAICLKQYHYSKTIDITVPDFPIRIPDPFPIFEGKPFRPTQTNKDINFEIDPNEDNKDDDKKKESNKLETDNKNKKTVTLSADPVDKIILIPSNISYLNSCIQFFKYVRF